MLGLGLAKNARVRVSQVLGLAKNASSSGSFSGSFKKNKCYVHSEN
jgi:hypothetical protein